MTENQYLNTGSEWPKSDLFAASRQNDKYNTRRETCTRIYDFSDEAYLLQFKSWRLDLCPPTRWVFHFQQILAKIRLIRRNHPNRINDLQGVLNHAASMTPDLNQIG